MNRGGQGWEEAGLSLPEALVALAVLLLLAGLAVRESGEVRAQQRVEAAARRLAAGLERGRAEAEARGAPCALALGETGWEEPAGSVLPGSGLPGCRAALALAEGVEQGQVNVAHNLPDTVRFTANGLVLDGGTVVVADPGTVLRRCLVVALPLGVVRMGRYEGPATGAVTSERCRPDPLL